MTNTAAMNLVRDNFCRKVSWVAKRHSLMKIMRTEHYLAIDCGLESDTFNSAVWLGERLDSTTQEQLEQVTQHFKDKNRALAFWVWDRPGLQPESLFATVGFEKAETNTAMWAEVGQIQEQDMQGQLEIEPVRTMSALVAYGENMATLFAESPEGAAVREYHATMLPEVLLGNALSAQSQPDTRLAGIEAEQMLLYVGRADSQVVTTGLLFLTPESAGIYDIATRQDARKRGFGSAMFHFLLNEGKKAGAKRFVLQASPDGLSIYERAGFQAVGDVLVFEASV